MDIASTHDARSDGRLLRVAGLVLLAVVAVLGTLRVVADAAPGTTVTVQTSGDGTSAAPDAIAVETIDFSAAKAAVEASGDAITIPTTIRGFVGVVLADADVVVDDASTSIAVTGTSSRVFGQDFPAAVDVAVIAVWDDLDDDAARVIVSAQLADSTLGELVGLDDGSAAAELPMPVGAVTVTNEPDATIPAAGESLLDPTTFPTNARAFFGRIDGVTLRTELPLRSSLNFQTAVDLGGVPAVAEALGLTPGDLVRLDGSVSLPIDEFPTTGSDLPVGLALRAELPGIDLPESVDAALGLAGNPIPAVFEIAVSDAGTPDDTSDDRVRAAVETSITLGDPLPAIEVDLSAEFVREGDDTTVTLVAAAGTWSQPFGVEWLEIDELTLVATIESEAGGAPVVTVALDGAASIAGKDVGVSIEGTIADPPDVSITVDLLDPVSLGELMDALAIDDAGGEVPEHVRASSVGPATLTLDIGDDGGTTTIDVSAVADIAFFAHADAVNPIAATALVEFSIGNEPSFTVGIRPQGPLNLSDLTPATEPDFELVTDETAVVFSFSTVALEADSVGDLTDNQQRLWAPAFRGDDAVVVPAGFNVVGTIELPAELADLVGDTLGLEPVVGLRGTVPIDPLTENFELSLSATLDADRTPEWIAGGGLSFTVAGNATGISIEIEGDLSVRFRAGLPADIADGLAPLGLDVYRDVPVASDATCRGNATVMETVTETGVEYRCFDVLNFTATASVEVNVTGVKADLALVIDTTNPSGATGWQPFGLDAFTLNRAAFTVGLSIKATDPSPKITIGVSGDVEIGDKDFLAAGKISVQPLPNPPFAKVNLEGFRFTTDAGFELDDFFEFQHALAELGATAVGDDPAGVPGPLTTADLGIPNVALRNVDVSFSTKGDATLCIPKGLFISADVYVDPTGEPVSRGAKCDSDGNPTPVPAGSTCVENVANGCVAGGRIAVDTDGFSATLDVVGFDLGPVSFDDARLELLVTADEQYLVVRGGVTVDAIGGGHLEVLFSSDSGSTTVEFAGRLDVGDVSDPIFSALADGSAIYDRTAFENSGFELRVVLDATNLSIEELGREFEVAASQAVEDASAAIILILDEIQAARAAFLADPGGFVRDELAALGVTIPPELQPLIDELAKFVAQNIDASEDVVLRGQFGGIPDVGAPKQDLCVVPTVFEIDDRCFANPYTGVPAGGVDEVSICAAPNVFESGGRCYLIKPIAGNPLGGVDKVPTCPLTSPFLHSDGKCYTIVPNGLSTDGEPEGGVDNLGQNCLVIYPFESGGRCYTIEPFAGSPSGGSAKVATCPVGQPYLSGGRCYFAVPGSFFGGQNGDPSGGLAPTYKCAVTKPFVVDGRCYTIGPIEGLPTGGAAKTTTCPALQPFLHTNDRCYTIPPGDIDPNGTPDDGLDPIGTGCPFSHPEEGVDGRCYFLLQAKTNGSPDGGLAKSLVCPVDTPFRVDGRCFTVVPQPPLPDADGEPKQNVCTFGLLAGADGLCYVIPPIDVDGLCDVFGLDPNCTFDDVIDFVIQPALLDAADITQEFFGDVVDVLALIESSFSLECAEFRLQVDGSTQNVDVSVTMSLDGELRTFTIGWDLTKPIAANLTSLLDGLAGASGGSCTPVDFTDFADDVIETDGGGLIRPVVPTPDSFELPEGGNTTIAPLDNDEHGDSATITGATAQSGSGVGVQVGEDGRTLIFTAPTGLAPGERRTVSFIYTAVNASGASVTGTGSITLIGRDDAPVSADDSATLDLRTSNSVNVAVLSNDSDTEDGTPTLVAASADGAAGCPTVSGDVIVFSAASCGGGAAYVALGEGQTLVDRFSYTVTDSNGSTTAAGVDVTVVGRNDAPALSSVRRTPAAANVGEAVSVSGLTTDPDAGDQLTVTIDWADGTTPGVTAVQTNGAFRVAHRFLRPGTFDATVTVTDRAGATNTRTVTFYVTAQAALAVAIDADGDLFPASVDCRDLDSSINPGVAEVPYDGIDNDCVNGDNVDVDGDGFTALQTTGGSPDCNDDDRLVNPGVDETPYDGIDNDCNGETDETNGPLPLSTVTLTADQASITNESTVVFRVTFDQGVTGFGADDVTTSIAGVIKVTAVDAKTYDVEVAVGTVDGPLTITVANAAAINEFGQASVGSVSSAVVVDREGIAATIDRAAGQGTETTEMPIRFSIRFDEPFDLTLDQVALVGTAEVLDAELSGAGIDWTVEVTQVGTSGGVTIALVETSMLDAAGNLPVVTVIADEVDFADAVAPVIDAPSAVEVTAEVGETSVVVEFSVTASDPANGDEASNGRLTEAVAPSTDVEVVCAPASGSAFDLGTTTVTCTAEDRAGNSTTATFDVTVERDATPIIAAGIDQIVRIGSDASGPISFSLPAATANAVGEVTFDCDPAIGTSLAPGTYTVTCVATDEAGSTSTTSFEIEVLAQPAVELPRTGNGGLPIAPATMLLLVGAALVGIAHRRRTAINSPTV